MTKQNFGFRVVLIIEKRALKNKPIVELGKLLEGIKIVTDIENLENFDVEVFAEEKKRQIIEEIRRMMKND